MGLPLAARISGDLPSAEGAAPLGVDVVSSKADFPYPTNVARLGLALLAVQHEDATAAAEQYQALQSIPGIMLLLVSTDRVLGLLSTTMGALDQAAGHFEDGLAFTRRAGYRPELAWTCCDYADALLQRDGPGDRAKATSLLDESLAISQEVGMRTLAQRVADRQQQLGSQPQSIPAYPDGLTQREVEVLRLIARGKSNSQISRELVVAEGTTRRHVSNIYAKIAVTNRAEATRYALRQGLLSLEEAQPSEIEE